MARPLMRKTLLLLGLFLCITGVRTVEVDDEEKFTYIKGDERGPEHWGDLVDGWEICGNGRLQSPIALVKSQAVMSTQLGELQRIYHPAKAILENRGHDIRVRWPTGGGSIVIDGKSYTLNECRWHSPSEHSLDGTIYPLEIQMEHQAQDNSSAVVAMLYSYGNSDGFLTKVKEKLPSIFDKEPPKEALGMVDPYEIAMGSKEYYRYNGSRTTPICTEGVTWTIFEKISTTSQEQVKALQAAIDDVQITMKTNKSKFKGLLKDGHDLFFANEVKNGHLWRQHMDTIHIFNQTIKFISKEVKRTPHNFTGEMIYMLNQIQDQKNMVWMEGSMGWIAWMDMFEDVLH